MVTEIDALQKLQWKDIREQVTLFNPELTKIIDDINPGAEFPIYKISYPYGEKILDQGTIVLPTDGNYHRLDHDDVPAFLKKELSYTHTPLIMQFHNKAEVFIEKAVGSIPIAVFLPGDLYGLFEVVTGITQDSCSIGWNARSGIRSVFMLPKIADAVSNRKLSKAYSKITTPPKQLKDHWQIFREIAQSSHSTWSSEIIVFSKAWFDHIKEKRGPWLALQNFLLRSAWSHSQFLRSKGEINIIWESFGTHAMSKGLKMDPYALDTVKHLAHIAVGSVPAFRPVYHDEQSLPIKLLHDAYLNAYDLKGHSPILMVPTALKPHIKNSKSVYYSLLYPTLVEGSPIFSKERSYADKLHTIEQLLKTFIHLMDKHQTKIMRYGNLSTKQFEFLHSAFLTEQESKQLENNVLQDLDVDKTALRKIHVTMTSSFFKGCIRISPYKN